jgi:gluconolactonase
MPGLEQARVLAEGLDHPEGVTVTKDGTLYAGGEAGQIYRIDPETGSVEHVASTGGFLLGLCADGDDRLYACDVGRRELLRVDPRSGGVEVWSNGTPDRAMVNPNWPVFDDAGNLYVTDSGSWKGDDGCIFRVDASGKTELWSEASTNFPNGACLSADGTALYVLESCTPAMVRISIDAPSRREVVATLDGVPDGVTLDTDGNAYVCFYRPDRISVVSQSGAVTVLAEDPEGTLLSAPTNGVWTGPGRLVTGNLGRWHLTLVEVNATGVPLRYPSL